MKINLKPFNNLIWKAIASCTFFVGIGLHTAAQKVEKEIEKQFDTYRRQVLQEKIYVHTDKDFYVAGEICWFKIYAVDAFFHKPLDVSKLAYAELLDNSNRPVVQIKIALDKLGGSGSLYLPVTINSGNYKLRVYTNWMKNFSADYFFEKTVSIVNTQQAMEPLQAPPASAYDIQFFPEGGNLVNGVQSKIAFKITDQNGKGVAAKLAIVNKAKDTVQTIESVKFGMGNFKLLPIAGEHYTAVLTMPNGKNISKDLLVPYNSGFVMHLLDDGGKQLKITVQSVADESAPVPLMLYLFVHTRGSIKVAASAVVQNGISNFIVEKDKLGDGISHFTIFTRERNPVCERLYFKQPTENVTIQITADQASYQLRQKINIGLTSTDQLLRPVEANMSMAVYRLDSLQSATASGISEYLWLSSDLPGNIESPEYYFNTSGIEVNETMDNLMLTNGWRRFKWEDVLQNKTPVFEFAPEYNGHLVTGKIVNSKSAGNTANITAYLSVPGTPRFRTAVSNSTGKLVFELQRFYGTPGIIVQADPEADSTCHVEIDNPFSNTYSKKSIPTFKMPANNPVTLLNQSINMQVENIYNGDIRKKVNTSLMDTTAFFQHANETYLLDNYVRFTTMEEVLREYVLSVYVRKKGGKFHLPMFNDNLGNGAFQNDPLVLLDGVPVFDMDKIVNYDPLKVRRLETVTRQYYYGHTASDGVINMLTYTGNLDGFELDPHATVIDYEALQLQRGFYSPVYQTPQQKASHRPDFRNVLYWMPTIQTDKAGKYQNSFYSADLPGKYVVLVQALTKDGKTGSGSLIFEVKKTLQ
jgi:hypothetical protein